MSKGYKKQGIRETAVQSSGNRIREGIGTALQQNVCFSYRYLNVDHPKFKYNDKKVQYFLKVIERLKALSEYRALDAKSDRGVSIGGKCL